MAELVSLFLVGGLAPRQAAAARTARGAARGVGGSGGRRARAAAARGAARARFRPTRPLVERGTGPRTLRTALRSRARRRGGAGPRAGGGEHRWKRERSGDGVGPSPYPGD